MHKPGLIQSRTHYRNYNYQGRTFKHRKYPKFYTQRVLFTWFNRIQVNTTDNTFPYNNQLSIACTENRNISL